MGVPYKYKGEETCDKYIELAEQGKSDIQIAGTLGVTVQCLYKWMETYPEFKQAREIGLDKCKMWWQNYMQEKGAGSKYKGGDFQAARFYMMNVLGWSDKQEFKVNQDDLTVKVELVSPESNEGK